ncbi:hypothetical protein AQJ30_20645 [Streptomyces longwoodensis]|uniref:NlpC/P60 domain-containing protein n=1 Tax=Streptomyces longwoodensis TaxID=68231 RepID=A0A101QV14_9ACTN|nr:peptidoglycan-binding protein [Streptomyces longwoodensis]KUN36646.1 hypothetical protein AQJ30_20645 [Streptomyces longwoodensis]
MEAPAFEDVDPGSDCDCPACGPGPLNRPAVPRGRPGSPAGRFLAAVATAAAATGAALGAAPAAAAAPHTAPRTPDRPGAPAQDEPGTPQGGQAPLHGPGGTPAQPLTGVKTPPTTRAEIIRRAKVWVAAQVPYSMGAFWSDGYRQDCSGFVSMAWGLPGNEWTGSLGRFGVRIGKGDLQPGDILLFHNPANPQKGSHVVIFGGWTDYTRTSYVAYEQTPPATRRRSTPYAYWSHSGQYVPYRYKGVTADTAGAEAGGGSGGAGGGSGGAGGAGQAAYPGRSSFGPGADNAYVTRLGQMLVARGGASFYRSGPGPRWGDADRRATEAFQLAQGWRGGDADGVPGPRTWSLLVSGGGRDIASGTSGTPGPSPLPGAPAFPGKAMFRPGAQNAHVTQLGRRLVEKGFGTHYTTGPGPRWGEADRRNVETFQRAQGWRGGAADGYPGPETWRRLFR